MNTNARELQGNVCNGWLLVLRCSKIKGLDKSLHAPSGYPCFYVQVSVIFLIQVKGNVISQKGDFQDLAPASTKYPIW